MSSIVSSLSIADKRLLADNLRFHFYQDNNDSAAAPPRFYIRKKKCTGPPHEEAWRGDRGSRDVERQINGKEGNAGVRRVYSSARCVIYSGLARRCTSLSFVVVVVIVVVVVVDVVVVVVVVVVVDAATVAARAFLSSLSATLRARSANTYRNNKRLTRF
jgi:hypothetical protein